MKSYTAACQKLYSVLVMRNKTWRKEITVRSHRCYCRGNMPFGFCGSFPVIISANSWFTAPLAWLLSAIVKIKSAFLKSVFLCFYGLNEAKKALVAACDIRVCDLCFCLTLRMCFMNRRWCLLICCCSDLWWPVFTHPWVGQWFWCLSHQTPSCSKRSGTSCSGQGARWASRSFSLMASSQACVFRLYRLGLQPHVDQVPSVISVSLARIGCWVFGVWGTSGRHVHPASPKNHLPEPADITDVTIMTVKLISDPLYRLWNCLVIS